MQHIRNHVDVQPEAFQRDLGARIRKIRVDQGFSQEGFADACKLHRTHISLLERGKIDPKLNTLRRVARILKISLAELLKDIG